MPRPGTRSCSATRVARRGTGRRTAEPSWVTSVRSPPPTCWPCSTPPWNARSSTRHGWGVLGGSHGGFMTTWLIGHTDRFSAAVSERAVNAIDSFEGSSDIGWDFADSLYGTDPDQRRRQSPLTSADAIDTPLLIIHSEHDWRCPIEQAQRLYVALKRRRGRRGDAAVPRRGSRAVAQRPAQPSGRAVRGDPRLVRPPPALIGVASCPAAADLILSTFLIDINS